MPETFLQVQTGPARPWEATGRKTGGLDGHAPATRASVGQSGAARPVVLVVDDDPLIRESVQWLLEDEGVAVVTAADGKQALEMALRIRPALVVLDIGLPLLSGEEVGLALQEQLPDPPPIVLVSAAGNLAAKARRIGAADYFSKPFDLDQLLASIHQLLHVPR